jgi:predicted 3-demethylubiquinone-9 3-methyltransferase (glyoxalase superfamily)
MQKITTFLTFDGQAEEAMNFYLSVFKDSKCLRTRRYGKGTPEPEGTFMTGEMEIGGQRIYLLNADLGVSFTMSISLFVNCGTQQEVDQLWAGLTNGGKEIQCGWLTDKYGVSWQIVPTAMDEMLSDKNPAKVNAVMQAMMKMVKLDIAKLKEAYDSV